MVKELLVEALLAAQTAEVEAFRVGKADPNQTKSAGADELSWVRNGAGCRGYTAR
jgi:hypothetical protein